MDNTMKLGILLSLKDLASPGLSQFKSNVARLGDGIKQVSNQMLLGGAAAKVFGESVLASLQSPIAAYADLDDASTRLRATMMDNTGKVSAQFGQIDALAKQLGNRLPGTTSDFHRMFETMLTGGAESTDIINGLGQSTAYLAAVLGRGYAETAKLTTNLKQIAGLKPGDMMTFLNDFQAATKLGAAPEELEMAFSRGAGALKQLNIQGLESSRQLGALFPLLIKTTKSGEIAGSGLGNILLSAMDAKKLKDANELLRQHGQHLTFIDKSGNFAGLGNFIQQLEKLRGLNQSDRAEVLKALVGGSNEALAVASTLIEEGAAGMARQNSRIQQQANLLQRVNEISKSTKSIWDAITGTFTGLLAELAKPAIDWLKPLADDLNGVVESTGKWVEKNHEIVKVGGLIVGGLGAIAVAVGTLSMAAGVLGKVFGGPLSLLGKLFGKGKGGLGGAAGGLMGGNGPVPVYVVNDRMSLIDLPGGMGKKAGGDAAGSAAGSAIGGALSSWLGKLKGALVGVGSALKNLGVVLLSVFGKGIRFAVQGIALLGRALLFNPIGLAITAIAVGALLIWKNWDFLKNKFTQLASAFKTIGGQLMDGLKNGVMAKWQALKERFSAMAEGIKNTFKSALGIHSPSRVFMEYGVNIGQGLTQGLGKSSPDASQAAANIIPFPLAKTVMPTVQPIKPLGSVPKTAAVKPTAAKVTTMIQANKRGDAGGMVIHFSPTIHAPGGDVKQVQQALKLSQQEFETLLRRYQAGQQRRAI